MSGPGGVEPSHSFADHIRARATDDSLALLFEDQSWTYRQWCAEVAARASLFASIRVEGPPHIGVLLENVPDFTMWLGAAAVSGAAVVGVNPTRRGAELERDIAFTDCQVVVTESSQLHLLEGLGLGAATGRVLVVDDPAYSEALAPHRGEPLPDIAHPPTDVLLLLFTSGTSGAPKAVITSSGRLLDVGTTMVRIVGLTADDVAYISMPLFHSNALFTAWAPSIVAGATVALRRTFSASGFVSDVRQFGATYFNYVGRPLAYVLATPERSDDADNTLRRGYGNEGSESDIARFAERFGCTLIDGYGQTEMGAAIVRVPEMPSGALGVAGAPTITVRHPGTGEECQRAIFDADGKLLNAEDAIGEIVNSAGGKFEGYWRNEEADRERRRDGAYWTGDLAYRDGAGFFYFAGRSADWIRVDGENFAGAPVERIISRYPGVVLAAAYGVPDPEIGDRLMVTLQMDGEQSEGTFDPDEFARFLMSQSDLGPKWVPTFVAVTASMPMTPTNKVLTRDLVARRWHAADDSTRIWWRPLHDRASTVRFVEFTDLDAAALREAFARSGRLNLL